MKRSLVFGFVALILIPATGCKGDDPESLVKQSISDMNALSDALEKKESPEKLKAAAEKLKATMQKLKDKKVPKEEDERLKQKYEKELTEAAMRMLGAAMKNPEGAMAIQDSLKDLK
jgi:hypothetical protein